MAGFDPGEGQDTVSTPESIVGCEDLGVHSWMTLIDITSLEQIKFGFVDHNLIIDRAMDVAAQEGLSAALAWDIDFWSLIGVEVLDSLQRQRTDDTSELEQEATETDSKKRKRGASPVEWQPQHPSRKKAVSKADELNMLYGLPYHGLDPSSPTSVNPVPQIMYLSHQPRFQSLAIVSAIPPWSEMLQKNKHKGAAWYDLGIETAVTCNLPLPELSKEQVLKLLGKFVTYLAASRVPLRASDVAMTLSKAFSLVSEAVDSSPYKVAPFPRTTHAHAVDLHSDRNARPPALRRLVAGEWTVVIMHQSGLTNRTDEKVRYIFMTPQPSTGLEPPSSSWGWHPPEELAVLGGTDLMRGASGASWAAACSDAARQEWCETVTKLDLGTCKDGEVDEILKAMTQYHRRSDAASRLCKTIDNNRFYQESVTDIPTQVNEDFALEMKQMSHESWQRCLRAIGGLRWLQGQVGSDSWHWAWQKCTIYPVVVCLIAIALIRERQSPTEHDDTSEESILNGEDDVLLQALKGDIPSLMPCLARLDPRERRVVSNALTLKRKGLRYVHGIVPVQLCCLLQLSDYLGQQSDYATSLDEATYKKCGKIYTIGCKVAEHELSSRQASISLRKLNAGSTRLLIRFE